MADFQNANVPRNGEPIRMKDGVLQVPDNPILHVIESPEHFIAKHRVAYEFARLTRAGGITDMVEPKRSEFGDAIIKNMG